jgi:hypothetical protein
MFAENNRQFYLRNIRSLAAGIAASVATIWSAPVQAVQQGLDGTGQVLLVPYYTVRNGFLTSFTVMNHSFAHTKVVKVRFREGLIGASVLDINLFLGPRDVWAAALADDGSAARLYSTDGSCTNPQVPTAGLPFSNRDYTGQAAGTFDDGGGSSLDRTREGHIEIIEMGVLAEGKDTASRPATAQGEAVSAAVRHHATGPSIGELVNCALVRVSNLFPAADDLRQPVGGLGGNTILIQASSGTEFVIPSTPLQRFFAPTDATADLYTEPGSLLPDLTSVNPARSDVWVSNPESGGESVLTVLDWVAAGGQPIDAVSAVLTRQGIAAEFDFGPAIRSEMVVTLPTKRYYTLPPSIPAPLNFAATSPFRQAFLPSTENNNVIPARSCDMVSQFGSGRQQRPYVIVTGGNFNQDRPPPPQWCTSTNSLVIALFADNGSASLPTFTAGSIFKSANTSYFFTGFLRDALVSGESSSGWLAIHPTTRFQDGETQPGPGQGVAEGTNVVSSFPIPVYTFYDRGGVRGLAPVHTDGIARRYRGLPMIGFIAVQALTGGQGYGGVFKLRTLSR